jgi:rare lipoprotein A (peptidoglycan hydrolase)
MKRSNRYLQIAIIIVALLAIESRNPADSSAYSAFPNRHSSRSIAIGTASYYSYECADEPMANGKPFDPEKRTCASWFYKLGTVLAVRSLDTGMSTEVVVTDRGPNKRLVKQGRIIDLSKRAFEDISPLKKGLTKVIVTVKSRKNS